MKKEEVDTSNKTILYDNRPKKKRNSAIFIPKLEKTEVFKDDFWDYNQTTLKKISTKPQKETDENPKRESAIGIYRTTHILNHYK